MILDELKPIDMFRPFFDIEIYTEGGTTAPWIRFISKDNEWVVYEYKMSSMDLFAANATNGSTIGPTIIDMVESMKVNLREFQLNKII